MERHTVPQNIMDIEFKLFGSLTIKQFSFVVVTFLTALMVYVSGLPEIITIPVIFVITLLGLALTFLKVNEMPFTVWFSNFITSTFTSQRKVYQRKGSTPSYLQGKESKPVAQKPYIKHKDLPARLNTRPNMKVVGVESRQSATQTQISVEDIFESKSEFLDNYFSAAASQGQQQAQQILQQEQQITQPAQQIQQAGKPAQQMPVEIVSQQQTQPQAPQLVQQPVASMEPTEPDIPATTISPNNSTVPNSPQTNPTNAMINNNTGSVIEQNTLSKPLFTLEKTDSGESTGGGVKTFRKLSTANMKQNTIDTNELDTNPNTVNNFAPTTNGQPGS